MGSAMQVLMLLIKYFIPVVILVLWVLMAISISNRIAKYLRKMANRRLLKDELIKNCYSKEELDKALLALKRGELDEER